MSEEDEKMDIDKQGLDRERGALTRGDRELLLGIGEYDTEQQRRNARYRLRKHLVNTFIDLSLVAAHIDDSELLQVKNKLQEDTEIGGIEMLPAGRIESSLFQIGLRSVFLEESMEELFSRIEDPHTDTPVEDEYISTEISSAIIRANRLSGSDPLRDCSVDVTIDRTEFDEEEFIEKLVHGSPTQSEFSAYISNGDISRLQEELRENDEVVDIESQVYTIGPDSETLARYSSERSN